VSELGIELYNKTWELFGGDPDRRAEPGRDGGLGSRAAVAADAAEAARYRVLGLEAVSQIADAEDGEHIAADLRGIRVPSANVGRTDRPG